VGIVRHNLAVIKHDEMRYRVEVLPGRITVSKMVNPNLSQVFRGKLASLETHWGPKHFLNFFLCCSVFERPRPRP